MRERYRRRVDWNEEERKTERIRRRGFSVSILSAVIAAAFIFFMKYSNESGVEFDPKAIFTLGLTFVAMFFVFVVFRRRARLRRERQELEEETTLRRLLNKNDDQ